MNRKEAPRWIIAVILTAVITGCGGQTTDSGKHVDVSDAAAAGAGGARNVSGGGGAGASSGGSAGSSGLHACNDGTGKGDCCSSAVAINGSCSPPGLTCSTTCLDGWRGEVYCSGGTWLEGHRLFPCGTDAGVQPGEAGVPGSIFCQSAGGQCVIGGSSCTTRTASLECMSGPNPGGAFCCMDPPAACTDANVQIIQASNYDQTCKTDADCMAVGEGNACYACVIECTSATINVNAHSRYLADVAKTPAGRYAGSTGCHCPEPGGFGPCCIAGACHYDMQCPAPGR
jgi:hypothetical protein